MGSTVDDPAEIVTSRALVEELCAGLNEVDRFLLAGMDETSAYLLGELETRFGCRRGASWLEKRRRDLRELAAKRIRNPQRELEDDHDADL